MKRYLGSIVYVRRNYKFFYECNTNKTKWNDDMDKTAIAIVNLPPRKMMGIDSEGMLISAVHEEDGHEGLNLLMVDDRIPAGAKMY